MIVGGWLLLGMSAVLWAWTIRRASRRNPTSPIPYFRKPPDAASHDRTLTGTSVVLTISGYLLVSLRTHDFDRWLALLVMGLIALLVVTLPIVVHNRRLRS